MDPVVRLRPDVAAMEGYHSAQVDVDVRLNTNEAPLPPPDEFVEEVAAAVRRTPFHRYPDRAGTELRTALADLHGVRPDQVFCGNGSNEVLQCVLLAVGGPGRTAAVFEPTYRLHSHIAAITGTRVATGYRGAGFTLDMDEVRRVAADHEPAVTFLCSPNNPTGRAEPRDLVEAAAKEVPGLLVVDEAYGQFAPWSALPLVSDEGRVAVVRTFSKTWSMAATRLGYLVGPAELVAGLEAVVLPYHLDALKQAAGVIALKFRDAMESRVAGIVEERGRVAAALGDLPVEAWPSDANFILFRPTGRPAGEVWQGLVDRSVLVRDCASWPGLDGCLRVTIGTAEENGAFIAALREVLT